jgi:putative chitinase
VSPEGSEAAISLAAQLVREATPCLLRAELSPEGVAEIGHRLRLLDRRGVFLGDTLTPEAAEAALLGELRGCWLEASRVITGWCRVGPARQAAAIAFLLGPGSSVACGRIQQRGDRLRQLKSAWAEPSAVAPLLIDFCRDGLGRVSTELAKRRNHEAALWTSEEVPVIRLRAIQETLIKRAPIPSSYLSAAGKIKVDAEAIREFDNLLEIAGDAHDWVTAGDLSGSWAIFGPHWEPADPLPAAKGKLPPVDWADMASPLGRFITVGEMLRNDPRRRPAAGSVQEQRLLALAKEFDAIRRAWGGAIIVTSGYRPEPFNREVGGVFNSRHVFGDALDISPADGRLTEMFHWIKVRWSGGLGDGRKRGFIHIDMREGGRFHEKGGVRPVAIWDY